MRPRVPPTTPPCYTLPYMDKNTKDILEALTFIKDRMATKDDVRDIIRASPKPFANTKTRSPIWKLRRTISAGTKPPPFEIQEQRSNSCAGPWPAYRAREESQ